MFNCRRYITATVIAFCLIGVLSVTAASTVAATQFMENPLSFFSPSPAQSNQNSYIQFPESPPHITLQPTLFMNLYTGIPETPSPEPYLQTYTLDQYGKLIIIDYAEIFRENDMACGNCGPVPAGSYNFADPLGEDQLMPPPRTIQSASPFIQPHQMIHYPYQ